MMSLTSELTTVPSAPPMITPIARARAFVLSRKRAGIRTDHRGTSSLRAPARLVLDDLGKLLRLVDPARDRRLGRDLADPVRARRVELLERLREVGRVALRQLGARVDAGRLEQVRRTPSRRR